MHAFNLRSQRKYSLLCTVILSLGLSACGGGGSSGGSTAQVAVTITPTNTTQVAGAAIDSALGGSSLPIGLQTTVSTSGQALATTGKTLAQIGQRAAQLAMSGGQSIASGLTATQSCTLSGTASSIIGTSSGTVTYINCSYVAGETLNGTISISNVVSTASLVSMDMAYSLTITTASPANTSTASGDMRIAMDNAFNLTMSGSNLSMSNTNAALGNFSLQNYSMSFDSAGNFTSLTYTFYSSVIGGTAVFTMTTPFTYGAGIFPSAGAATVTGAGGSRLRITVLGDENAAVGSQVKLELSSDGGATYGTPTYVTWATVSSLI